MDQGRATPPDLPSRSPAPGHGTPSEGAFESAHDVDAERAVLGACMGSGGVVDAVRHLLGEGAFYRPAHETVWQVLLSLHSDGKPTDPIVLVNELSARDDLGRVGGAVYIHQLYDAVPSVGGAEHYAQIVREKADLRRVRTVALQALQRTQEPGADPDDIRSGMETDLRAERERSLASGQGRLSRYLVDGWRFVSESGAGETPLWGTPRQTLWASGESLMIVGPPGVGKTTLAHQVVLARLGLRDQVLDMPIAPSRRVLYLAMDRPKQIAKAMARGIDPQNEAVLRDRLCVWQGPLPATIDKEPDLLADLAAAHQADTIVIDSLKDAVSTLVDDALAVAFHNARMRALRNGVEVLELHHQRKAVADAPRGQRPTLDRVYGSTWITSGAGSVLFIAGEAGDPAVTLHHLKHVTGEVGPLQIIHDHERGATSVEPSLDPVALLRAQPNGLTTRELAAHLSGENSPGRADIEKARRQLEGLVKAGLATKAEGAAGGPGGGQQARYRVSNLHIAVS